MPSHVRPSIPVILESTSPVGTMEHLVAGRLKETASTSSGKFWSPWPGALPWRILAGVKLSATAVNAAFCAEPKFLDPRPVAAMLRPR